MGENGSITSQDRVKREKARSYESTEIGGQIQKQLETIEITGNVQKCRDFGVSFTNDLRKALKIWQNGDDENFGTAKWNHDRHFRAQKDRTSIRNDTNS